MYSQRDEEKYILEALAGITDGVFLDIGASDGKVFSNTRALADLGWSGVLVEASNHAFHALEENTRDNDKMHIIAAAMMPQANGLVKFWQTQDMVSTTSKEHADRWKDSISTNPYRVIYSATTSYDDILESTDIPFNEFDFVSLDIEGTNYEVFVEMMKAAHTINKAMCIEFDDKRMEVEALALVNGFRLVHETSENLILVR